jgi:hypothetical protein
MYVADFVELPEAIPASWIASILANIPGVTGVLAICFGDCDDGANLTMDIGLGLGLGIPLSIAIILVLVIIVKRRNLPQNTHIIHVLRICWEIYSVQVHMLRNVPSMLGNLRQVHMLGNVKLPSRGIC